MDNFYKYLRTFIGMLTDIGSLAWEHLVDYKDFLWRVAKRFALYAAIPIPILLICLIFGWPVNWLYSAYFIFVGAEAVILMVLAFPIIAATQFIFDKFPQFAANIQKTVQKIAAVAFWALMLAVCFYVFPVADNPKMVPLVLMAAAALALGAYAGWVHLPTGLVKTIATVFLIGIFVIATFAFCFPYRTQQLVGLTQNIDIGGAQPKRLTISYEDLEKERIPFFRPDGKPKVWYFETEDGRFELFDKRGFHPIYAKELKPLTPDIVSKLKEQLRKEESELKEKEKAKAQQEAELRQKQAEKERAREQQEAGLRQRQVGEAVPSGFAPRSGQVTGVVCAISDDWITVKSKSVGEVKIALDKNTKFGTKANPKAFSDFKVYDKVIVFYKEDGDKKCATDVRVPAAKSLTAPQQLSPANDGSAVNEIIKMQNAGFAEDTIVSYIKGKNINYDISADEAKSLRQSGIPAAVLNAMLASGGVAPVEQPPARPSPAAIQQRIAELQSAIQNTDDNIRIEKGNLQAEIDAYNQDNKSDPGVNNSRLYKIEKYRTSVNRMVAQRQAMARELAGLTGQQQGF